jgi:hypothetical protein
LNPRWSIDEPKVGAAHLQSHKREAASLDDGDAGATDGPPQLNLTSDQNYPTPIR